MDPFSMTELEGRTSHHLGRDERRQLRRLASIVAVVAIGAVGTPCVDELYVMYPDGTTRRGGRTDLAPSSQPTWSPDGTDIAYRLANALGRSDFDRNHPDQPDDSRVLRILIGRLPIPATDHRAAAVDRAKRQGSPGPRRPQQTGGGSCARVRRPVASLRRR